MSSGLYGLRRLPNPYYPNHTHTDLLYNNSVYKNYNYNYNTSTNYYHNSFYPTQNYSYNNNYRSSSHNPYSYRYQRPTNFHNRYSYGNSYPQYSQNSLYNVTPYSLSYPQAFIHTSKGVEIILIAILVLVALDLIFIRPTKLTRPFTTTVSPTS